MNFIFWIYATTTVLSMCNGFPSKRNQSGHSLKLHIRARLKQGSPNGRKSAASISAYAFATPRKGSQVKAKQGSSLGGNKQSSPKRKTLEARISAYILKNKPRKGSNVLANKKPAPFPTSSYARGKLHKQQPKHNQSSRQATYSLRPIARKGARRKIPKKTAGTLFPRLASAKKPAHLRNAKQGQKYQPETAFLTATRRTPHNIKIHQTIIVNKGTNTVPSGQKQNPIMPTQGNGLPAGVINKWHGNRGTGNSHNHGGINGFDNRPNGGSNAHANNYQPSWGPGLQMNLLPNAGVQDNVQLLELLNSFQRNAANSRNGQPSGGLNHVPNKQRSRFDTNRVAKKDKNTSSKTSKNVSKITIFPNHPSIKQITIQGQRPVVIATGQKKIHYQNNPKGSSISIRSNMWTSSPHRTVTPPEELPEREI